MTFPFGRLALANAAGAFARGAGAVVMRVAEGRDPIVLDCGELVHARRALVIATRALVRFQRELVRVADIAWAIRLEPRPLTVSAAKPVETLGDLGRAPPCRLGAQARLVTGEVRVPAVVFVTRDPHIAQCPTGSSQSHASRASSVPRSRSTTASPPRNAGAISR